MQWNIKNSHCYSLPNTNDNNPTTTITGTLTPTAIPTVSLESLSPFPYNVKLSQLIHIMATIPVTVGVCCGLTSVADVTTSVVITIILMYKII